MHKKLLIGIITLVVLGGAASGLLIYRHKTYRLPYPSSGKLPEAQSHPTYNLSLLSGVNYDASKPTALKFTVKDQTGKTLKDFDTSLDEPLNLAIIRADRSTFQHLHPVFNPSDGSFEVQSLTFPGEGQYRVYANFTARNAQTGPDGTKLSATVDKEVVVGSLSDYKPIPIGIEKSSSSVNRFDASFFFPPGDDSPGSLPDTKFYAGQVKTLAISIDKNSLPFKNIEPYKDILGRLAVIDPDMQLQLANSNPTDVINQSGLLTFNVKPQVIGLHKVFLQIRVDGQLITFDFTLNVVAQ